MDAMSPNHRMTLIRRQIAPPAERYLVISVALLAVRACFRVRRRSTRTSTDGPPGSSVNPSRPALTTSEEPSNATTWEPNFRMGDIRPLRVTDTKKRIVPGGRFDAARHG